MAETLLPDPLPRSVRPLPRWIIDKTLHDLDETAGGRMPNPDFMTDEGERKSWGPVEQGLQERFPALVEGMELASVIQLEPGRRAPKGLEKYQLVPLVTDRDGWYPHSTDRAADYIKIPEEVRVHYGSEGEAPWLDSSYAIGLVYKDMLTAVAGGHTTYTGNIRVTQLQGVYQDGRGRGYGYQSGLFGGFLWRHTLIQAWTAIACQLGAPAIEVLSVKNSPWRNKGPENMLELLRKGYDDVAKQMGFRRNHRGNFKKLIEPGLSLTSGDSSVTMPGTLK